MSTTPAPGVMIVTSRHPIRQGSRLIPKGSRGRFSTPEEWSKWSRLVNAILHVQLNISLHINAYSSWSCVTFEGFEPMIVAAKEIETTWETEVVAKPEP